MIKKYYYNEKVCEICGGKCCKSLPGAYSPDDIQKIFPAKNLKASVKKALATKKVAIDWWDGAEPLYFIRPATKDKVGVIYDPSWGGVCVFLGLNGCELDRKNRPETCKRLDPRENGNCVFHFKTHPKLFMAKKWQKSNVDLGNFKL